MTRRKGSGWRAALIAMVTGGLTWIWTPQLAAQLPAEAQYQPPSGSCVYDGRRGFSSPGSCALVIVKPSIQVRNLAPQVVRAEVWCAAKISEPDTWATAGSNDVPIVNGDASSALGSLVARIGIHKSFIQSGQSVPVVCELVLARGRIGGPPEWRRLAVPSASTAAPLVPADDNWHMVDSSSSVKWTTTITFPQP